MSSQVPNKTNPNKPTSKALQKQANGRGRRGGLRGPFFEYIQRDPFPPRMRCILNYQESITMSSPASAATYGTEQVYNLNSLFKPNATSAGHQPYGFDQLSALYNKYKVFAVDMDIIIQSLPNEDLVSTALILVPDDSGGLAGSAVNTYLEKPMCVSTRNSYGSNTSITRIRQSFPMHAISAASKLQFDADYSLFAALVAFSPTKMPTVHFAVANSYGTAADSLKVTFCFRFHAEFCDRLVQAQS